MSRTSPGGNIHHSSSPSSQTVSLFCFPTSDYVESFEAKFSFAPVELSKGNVVTSVSGIPFILARRSIVFLARPGVVFFSCDERSIA